MFSAHLKKVDYFEFCESEKAELSLRQVAELLLINDNTLASYESGERLVRADVLCGMSQINKTSIDLIIEKSMPVLYIV